MTIPSTLSGPWPSGPSRPWDPPDAMPPRHGRAKESGGSGEPSFGFWDLLDIVNPLQHIPLVNIAYREITGDRIDAPARILGGALYGGPIGLLSGAVQAILEESTGRDAGEHVMAALFGEDGPGGPVVADASDPADAAAGNREGEPAATDQAVRLRDRVPVARIDGPRADASAPQPTGLPPAPRLDLSPPVEEGRPIVADARLDAALTALAIASSPAPHRPAHGPAADAPHEDHESGRRPRHAPDRLGGAAASDVPGAMMRALDLYQRTARLGDASAG